MAEVAREQLDVEEVRRRFEADGLTWDETWAFVARHQPGFAEAYRRLRAVPVRKNHLSRRLQSLVELTINAATTHLNVAEIGPSLRRALEAGAQPVEVLECLELAATVGVHSMNIGVPLLVEVLEEFEERFEAEFRPRLLAAGLVERPIGPPRSERISLTEM